MPETFSRLPESTVRGPELIGPKFLNELKQISLGLTSALLVKWKLSRFWLPEGVIHPADNSLEIDLLPISKLPQNGLLKEIEAESLDEVQVGDVGEVEDVERIEQVGEAEMVSEAEGVEQIKMVAQETKVSQVAISETSVTEANVATRDPLAVAVPEKSEIIVPQARKEKDYQRILEIIARFQTVGISESQIVGIPQSRTSRILQEIETIDIAEKNPERILEVMAQNHLEASETRLEATITDLEILKPAEIPIEDIAMTEIPISEVSVTEINIPEMSVPELTFPEMTVGEMDINMPEIANELPNELLTPITPAIQEFQHFTEVPQIAEVSSMAPISPQTFSESSMKQALGSLGSIGLSTGTLGQPQLGGQSYGTGYSALPLAL